MRLGFGDTAWFLKVCWLLNSRNNSIIPNTRHSGSNQQRSLHCAHACSVVITRPRSRNSSALEFIQPRFRPRPRDLTAKISVLVSKPGRQGLGLGLQFFLKSWQQHCEIMQCTAVRILVTITTQCVCYCKQMMGGPSMNSSQLLGWLFECM